MNKLILTVCILFPLCITFTGCGTIMSGNKQEVGFSSNPSNALVTIDGEIVGHTPLTTELSRKKTHDVVMTLDGYLPYEMTLIKKSNGWVWGNIVFGGLIGLGVDALTGAMYKLTPEQVEAEMKRGDVSSIKIGENTLYVAITLRPDTAWQKIGNLQSF